MKNIFNKQNTDELLILQFSQRKHYERAEKLQYVLWVLMVINIIVSNTNVVRYSLGFDASILLSSVITILYIFFKEWINKNVQIGAYTKELIDCKLFEFKIVNRFKKYTEKELYELAIYKKNKNKKEYYIQVGNTGIDVPRGVKNWYSNYTHMNKSRAILECQKENLWWDRKLSGIYVNICCGLIVFIMIISIYINRNNTLWNVICSQIIPIIPIIIELVDQVKKFMQLKTSTNNCNSICNNIERNISVIEMRDLEELQGYILERRLNNLLIPKAIHSILSKNLHSVKVDLNKVDTSYK